MSTRTSGYTYKRRRDGTRYRVYRRKTRYSNRFAGIKPKRASMRRSYITGFGAYYKKAGIAYGRPPSVVNHPDGRVIIRHAEYLEDVPSATAFAIATYPLNPGMQQTFPWLSRIAQNFEEWLPRGIFFEFKTTSSDMIVTGATTPALGQISMATQYNSLDSDFINNVQLLNYENASTCKPSQNLRHYVECKRSQTVMSEMYIRTGSIPPNADLRLYDLGKTSVASSSMQTDGQMMGQLWVSYEIELRKPKIQKDLVGTEACRFIIPQDIAGLNFNKVFGSDATIGPEVGSSLSAVRLRGQPDDFGAVFLNDVQWGYYLVVYHGISNGVGALGNLSISTITGCELVTVWDHNTKNWGSAPANGDSELTAGGVMMSCVIKVNVTSGNAMFMFGWGGGGTLAVNTADSSDLMISRLPTSMFE